jgi:hypothetical protein
VKWITTHIEHVDHYAIRKCFAKNGITSSHNGNRDGGKPFKLLITSCISTFTLMSFDKGAWNYSLAIAKYG